MTPPTQSTGELEDVHGNPMKQSVSGILNDLVWKDVEFEQAVVAVESIIRKEAYRLANEVIDRVESSVKQHTVPEGWDLATKSYIFNTLEFERSRLQSLIQEDADD